MNILQTISGVVLLIAAAILGCYALENRALVRKAYAPQQEISAAHLAQWGPQEKHAVRITHFDWGTPITEADPTGQNWSAVWLPIYPEGASDLALSRPPHILLHSTRPRSPADLKTFLEQATCTGTVLNGLPLWNLDLSPAVLARWPELRSTQVWLISDQSSRWPMSVIVAGIMAFTCGVVGAFTVSNAFVPTRPVETSPRKSLPLLAIPEQHRTLPPSEENRARSFFHPQCQTSTSVSDDALVLLECAFQPPTDVYCCGCDRELTLDQLYWGDTGENILQYHQRLIESVSYFQRIYLTYFATPYAAAINLGLNDRGEPTGDVGQYTFPPEFLHSLGSGNDAAYAKNQREDAPELVHSPRSVHFGPFTVNEFGLEVHTPQGKVTAVWDDVQSAELSQGVMLVEIRRGGGSSTIFRVPCEEIPNAERFLQFLAEVAPVGAVIV